ncbi:MAG: hypothetical protein ACK4OM_06945 [Alphaproteobacteria bacterium]
MLWEYISKQASYLYSFSRSIVSNIKYRLIRLGIFDAVLANDLELVNKVLKDHPEAAFNLGSKGSALHYAALRADITFNNEIRNYFLHIKGLDFNANISEYFEQLFNDTISKDNRQLMALDELNKLFGHEAVEHYLLSKYASQYINFDNWNPNSEDTEKTIKIIEAITKAGAKVNLEANFIDNFVMTPLSVAVRSGHKRIIEKFLELGADINKLGLDNLIEMRGKELLITSTIKFLITKGLNINEEQINKLESKNPGKNLKQELIRLRSEYIVQHSPNNPSNISFVELTRAQKSEIGHNIV